jgi:hypothetical protein
MFFGQQTLKPANANLPTSDDSSANEIDVHAVFAWEQQGYLVAYHHLRPRPNAAADAPPLAGHVPSVVAPAGRSRLKQNAAAYVASLRRCPDRPIQVETERRRLRHFPPSPPLPSIAGIAGRDMEWLRE